MTMIPEFGPGEAKLICGRCNVKLEQIKVSVFYLNSAFEVVLPRCPKCGLTYVPKELAQGKMLEVETLLEDK